MSIQLLSDLVVAQIAAGEVVERPASVVKELVENALDAGAKSVHVEATEGGQKLIRVSDDGSGISLDDVEYAFARHATSKLASVEDLNTIRTLGFRGEALASIASVSRLTATTRSRGEDVGTQLTIHGGEVMNHRHVGAPAGTVIAVENLFFNTPARLKFLKAESTEKRHITTVVTRYAMAYPNVRFTLVQDSREVFRSAGRGQLADVVVKVMGLDVFKQMIEVDSEDPLPRFGGAVQVNGYVSEPDLNRNDRSRMTLFVNGRVVQDGGLNHAVSQAYHQLAVKGRHPYAVLMIDVPTEFVDVNVHPTKAEVRFQDQNAVFVAVQRAVRSALLNVQNAYRVHTQSNYEPRQESRAHWSDSPEQLGMDLPSASKGRFPEPDLSFADLDDDDIAIPEGVGQPVKPRTLPVLRVVGQIGATYIIAEGPAGMYLVDQHTAHQRILYQTLLDALESGDEFSVELPEIQTIDLLSPQARLLEANLTVLNNIGFEIEPFGNNTYAIRRIPYLLEKHRLIDVIAAFMTDFQGETEIEDLIKRVAEQAAIRAGQVLSPEDMQQLIRQLERCPSPQTSPYGQATIIHMTAEQIAYQFRH